MAPNRKKGKKPVANPARGFATTSQASKPRPTTDEETQSVDGRAGLHPKIAGEEIDHSSTAAGNTPDSGPAKELAELTPEQLEAQLEESELQLFVEKHIARVTQEAQRQISRLQTERRVLRTQGERLNLGALMSQDLIEKVQQRIRQDNPQSRRRERDPGGRSATTDDLIQRAWAMRRTLQGLGFSKDRADDAIRYVFNDCVTLGSSDSKRLKDSGWGLELALDWLASTSNYEHMPRYEGENFDKDAVNSPETPGDEGPLGPDSGTASSSKPSAATKATNLQRRTREKHVTSTEEMDPDVQAVLDADVEPHELLDRYIKLQSILFERRPDLTSVLHVSRKRWKPSQPPNVEHQGLIVSKLLQEIATVERDVLFDSDLGKSQWHNMRTGLLQEMANKPSKPRKAPKALLHDEALEDSQPHSNSMPVTPASDENELMGLGDFFDSLPQETLDGQTGVTEMAVASEEGVSVTIRSFGQWSGVSPRRVLQDNCRARDPAYQIKYTVVSRSTFSNRHSVSIDWSKPQEIPEPNEIPGIDCSATSRGIRLHMSTVSAPDVNQSEALISSAALFYIFASSLKEEKAYLRLPSVFRDYWAELLEARELRKSKEDQDEVKYLRHLLEPVEAERERYAPSGPSSIADVAKPVNSYQSQITRAGRVLLDAHTVFGLWAAKSSTASFQKMLVPRKSLPIWNFRDEILGALEKSQVLIICGETGCGKSTQVPSYILEQCLLKGQDCKIYCTEPRRISAISLARRVSEELGERKEDVGTQRSLVGFAVRLESQISASTRLVYATTGVVMRMLEQGNSLGEVTHLVLDEVHERNIESDFLLIILRKIMAQRPTLKVILMSATLNAAHFSRYLDDAPIFNVPGRTFPVDTRYLEDAVEESGYRLSNDSAIRGQEIDLDEPADEGSQTTASGKLERYSSRTRSTLARLDEYRINYDLICRLLEHVATSPACANYSKAILVFLPGLAEIRRLYDLVSTSPSFVHGWIVIPLHSTIAMEDQERAFWVPPSGMRKIVLATNIAETGITIPDVTCVIDSGKHKEMRFDEKRQLSRLTESFIAQANAKQRRGRAGRVQSGLCFHLFTRARYERIMAEQQTPEMLRLSLQDLALRVKLCKLGAIEETLQEALDPPLPRNVRRAVDSLIDVKALTPVEELTSLGRQLAKLPLDVYLGKLIILSSIFRCLDAGLTMAALLSSKSPFVVPVGARQQADAARLAFRRGNSDLLTIYNAYSAWRRVCQGHATAEGHFCRKNYMSSQTLSNVEELKAQLAVALHDAGFLVLSTNGRAALSHVRSSFRQRHFVELPAEYDTNSNNDMIISSVIAWSFYPKLLHAEGKSWRNVSNNQLVSLFPASVNRAPASAPTPKWLSYYHIMQSSSKAYHAHETSAVDSLAVALNCGETDFKMYAGVVVIDGNRVRFCIPDWADMLMLKSLRRSIRGIIAQSIRSPGRQLSADQEAWLDILRGTLSRTEDKG